MPKDMLYFTQGKDIKSIDLPQYPDAAWDFITETPQVKENDYYSRVSAVYRAANMNANAVANIPFALVNKSGEDVDTSEDWKNIVSFMPRPRELLRLWRLSLFMTGSAYGFMEGNSVAKSLRYILPTTITPIVDATDGLTGFKRTIGTVSKTYSLNERRIFYMHWMDHTTELLPTKNTEFRALMAAAGVLFYADYYVQNFFQRGGIKPTMLMVKGVPNQQERERIEKVWDKVVHGWYKYLGKIFNAESIEPHVIGEGIDNLNDSAMHNEKISDIAMSSGIPLSLLLANSATYATAQAEYATWFRDAIPPWVDFISDAMNEQLFKPLGLRIDFRPEMTDPGQEDEVSRAGAYEAYIRTGMRPSVAAQILGIELPPDMDYDALDDDEPEPEPEPEPETDAMPNDETDDEPEQERTPAKFIPTMEQFRELELWQSLAFRKVKRGDEMNFPFELRSLPETIGAQIRSRLVKANTEDEIKAAFILDDDPVQEQPQSDYDGIIKALESVISGLAEIEVFDEVIT